MQNVFINYRRSDVPIIAQFIENELAKRFGHEHIFFDRDIPPGTNFVEALKAAVGNCQMLLALIGPEWLNKQNKARLHLEDDWVRIEIATALARKTCVIPVFVGGAKEPKPADLPADIVGLLSIQGVFLKEDDLWTGMNSLLSAIESDLGLQEPIADLNKTEQIDELLRRARLIKADADQLLLDQMSRSTQFRFGNEGSAQIDLRQQFSGFDDTAHKAKLNEAFDLLKRASSLDDTNPEVMLATAELLTELTPDDPSDEQKLLFKVKSLISNPKNETEQFQLAKATFLLALSGDNLHRDALEDARATFEKLGRRDWVRQCDDLLRSQDVPAGATVTGNVPEGAELPETDVPSPPSQFNPVGNWRICDTAYCPSTWDVQFFQNGGFQGQQSTPAMGIYGPVSGQWGYEPYYSAFHIQGMLNGMVPFGTTIYIQRFDGNVWHGTGMDGMPYSLAALGQQQ